MNMQIKYLFLGSTFGFLLLGCLGATAQIQKGQDINGVFPFDQSGTSISMPDAETIAIGATRKGQIDPGFTRIYEWKDDVWTQKGADLFGEQNSELFGAAVSMPDANTVAVGAPFNNGNSLNAGLVRIFSWRDNAWVLKGEPISGPIPFIFFGMAVSMPDANTVAVGATGSSSNSTAGYVYIYEWDSTEWVQKGQRITGEAEGDGSGTSVSMPDPSTVAIGATGNDDNGNLSGHVRIFNLEGNRWQQKGGNIAGKAGGDRSGTSVSMPDPNTVAIGSPGNDRNGILSGHVRVFLWNGSVWQQKGDDIEGEMPGKYSGASVSMPDANIIAIGAPANMGNGDGNGEARVYQWNGNAWRTLGEPIQGSQADEELGTAVSMPDRFTLAVSAPFNNSSSTSSGQVRVFEISPTSSIDQTFQRQMSVYPNPTSERIHLVSAKPLQDATLILRNSSGQELNRKESVFGQAAELQIPGTSGIYFIEVKSGHQKGVFQVVKH